MVDEERVARLLQGIRRDVAYLAHEATTPHDVLEDETRLAAVKYRFVTAIEGTARVAHHICVAEGWSAPETNADALRELARHGVLLPSLADDLARAAGFRNVLVHQYADVDDRIVVANLERVSDLDRFVAEVAAWLT